MKRHTERTIRCLDCGHVFDVPAKVTHLINKCPRCQSPQLNKTTHIADLYVAERTNRRFYK